MARKPLLELLLLSLLCLSASSSSSVTEDESTIIIESNDHDDIQQETARRAQESRIVGGVDAAPGSFPFFGQWTLGCGASLIAPDMLLSAAHCYTRQYGMGRILLGSIYPRQGVSFDVIDIWVYPSFNGDYYSEPKNDFLVIKLNQTVPTSIATPVALNGDSNVPAEPSSSKAQGEWLTVIGMGSLDEKGNRRPDILQQVDLPYYSTAGCQDAWSDTVILPTEMCTLHPDGGYDGCYGDSGGPMLTSENVQVGVVSWGDGCGRRGSPAVFSRVSAVRDDFIYPTVCENSRQPPSFCSPNPLTAPEVNGDGSSTTTGGTQQQQRKDPSETSKCGSVTMNNGRGGAAGASKDCTDSRMFAQGGGLRNRRKLKGTKRL